MGNIIELNYEDILKLEELIYALLKNPSIDPKYKEFIERIVSLYKTEKKKIVVDDLLTEKEACKRLRMKSHALHKRRKYNMPPNYIKIGGRIYYEPQELEKLIKIVETDES